MTRLTERLTQRVCTSIRQHITRSWQSKHSLAAAPALLVDSSTSLLLAARPLCSAAVLTRNTAHCSASNSASSHPSSIFAKNHAIAMLWRSMQTTSTGTTEEAKQHALQKLLKCSWHPATRQQVHLIHSSTPGLLLCTQHAKHWSQRTMSTGTPCRTTKRQQKVETGAKGTTDALALIPRVALLRANQLSKLMTQHRKKRSGDKLETQYSAQIRQKLKARFRAVVQEAAAMPHWKAHPAGFLACLQDVELLFRQLFAPLRSESPPEFCCSVAATSTSVSQCIERILPVLLQPQAQQGHGGARNMVGVAEFLQDMMGMDGSQMFRCFVQEPSVLYLDVYHSLLPLQDYFQKLHWDPAAYNKIMSRHPQILLLPLQQFQRSIGYLLGQGLTQADILSMWGQRAGLLVEPLDRLHGEVLALRASNRPLQDLALPFHQRAAPMTNSSSFQADGESFQPPARTGRMAAAISSLVGTPQSVYLYQHKLDRMVYIKGVYQNKDGQFIAKAPVGRNGANITLGIFPTEETAAKAYDAALYKNFGLRRLFNYPEDYPSMSTQTTEDIINDTPKSSKPSRRLHAKLALQH